MKFKKGDRVVIAKNIDYEHNPRGGGEWQCLNYDWTGILGTIGYQDGIYYAVMWDRAPHDYGYRNEPFKWFTHEEELDFASRDWSKIENAAMNWSANSS